MLGAPAGLGAYLAFCWVRYGTPLAPLVAQTGWQREFRAPWQTLADAVAIGLGSPGVWATGYHTLDLLVALPVLVAVVWLVARAPAAYGAYAVAHALVWLAYPFPDRPLMSVPRFALAVVPVFWAFAAWTRRRALAGAWWAGSGALLGIHLLLFVTWYYVF